MTDIEISDTNNINNIIEIDETFENSALYTIQSKIWAEGSDEQVETLNGEHSAKVWAKKAQLSANEANNSSQLSQSFAEIAQTSAFSAKNSAEILEEKLNNYTSLIKFGVKWRSFKQEDWIVKDNYYKLFLQDKSVVFDVYKANGDVREKIFCDIDSTAAGVEITSLEAFDGYLLTAANTIGDYVFEQTEPAQEWIIEHNLGKYPSITTIDTEGNVIVGERKYIDLNTIKCTFKQETTGKVLLN